MKVTAIILVVWWIERWRARSWMEIW